LPKQDDEVCGAVRYRYEQVRDKIFLYKYLPTPPRKIHRYPTRRFPIYECSIEIPADADIRPIDDSIFWTRFTDFIVSQHLGEVFKKDRRFVRAICEDVFVASYHLTHITGDSVYVEEGTDFIIRHRACRYLRSKLPCKSCSTLTRNKCKYCDIVHYCSRKCVLRDRGNHDRQCTSFQKIPKAKYKGSRILSAQEVLVRNIMISLQMGRDGPICRICADCGDLRKSDGYIYCIDCLDSI